MQTSKTITKAPKQKAKRQSVKTKKTKDLEKEKPQKTAIPRANNLEKKRTPRALERYEKLIKSFRSLKNIVALSVFVNIVVDIYYLFLVFSTKGSVPSIISFVLAAVLTGGLFYTSRLLSVESRKAMIVYSTTIGIGWILILVSRIISHSALFIGKDIISLVLPTAIFISMYRLSREGILT